MKLFNIGWAVVVLALAAGCASKRGTGAPGGRQDVLHTCNCGPQCKCNVVSTTPGKCACGTALKWGHLLRVEGNVGTLCQCNAGCTCGGLDPKDPAKCVCGTPVKRVNLAGTGIYFCNCGGACSCNTVSPAPGKCKCGMELKKVE